MLIPIIQISKAAWPHIQIVLNLDLQDLRSIVDCLVESPPHSDVEDLAAACASQLDIESVNTNAVEAVIALSINLSRLEREIYEDVTGEPVPSVAETFANALEQSKFPDWSEELRKSWLERVEVMAPIWSTETAIAIMSKARELLFDFQCVLRQSAVLTDVRHIFDRAATKIVGALVLHTLSLEYMEGESGRALHLTLSPKDVEELIEKLQRAQQKAQVTSILLDQSGVPELTPKRN